METKFKETKIPEDFSKAVSLKGFLIGTANVYRVATVLFDGVSNYFGAFKSKTSPKALVFKKENGEFLAGAKVEYIGNDDDPANPSAGQWSYIWTFDEKDLEGADIVDAMSNQAIITFFTASGLNRYNMKFAGVDLCATLMILMLEMIKKFLEENASEGNECSLVLDQVFKATATVENGVIEMGLVPDGEMKVLIKDDSAIQEN